MSTAETRFRNTKAHRSCITKQMTNTGNKQSQHMNEIKLKETKLRKYEHLLAISGAGVIAFGIWSVVKAAIYFLLVPLERIDTLFSEQDLADLQSAGASNKAAGIITIVVILAMLLVDLLLRYYVGRSAVLEGRRIRKKRITYVVVAAFIGFFLLLSIVMRFYSYLGEQEVTKTALDTASVSIVVDITSLLATIEMIVAAIMVRRLRKELGVSGTEVK